MTGALLSSVRRFQFPVSSPVPVEGIQSCGAEGILESFALSIGNHADDLEHSGHVMHEPDAIQLSLLDGFRRTLAEREGFYCSTLKQRRLAAISYIKRDFSCKNRLPSAIQSTNLWKDWYPRYPTSDSRRFAKPRPQRRTYPRQPLGSGVLSTSAWFRQSGAR